MHIDLTPLTFVLFLLGLLTGMYSAVVGGGAILLVPVFSLMGTPLAVAIATMRLGAVFQQLVATAAFWKEGKIAWKPAAWITAICVPGAYLGARLAVHLDPHMLSYVVAVLMFILLGVVLCFDRGRLRKRPAIRYAWPILIVFALVLGFYGGFYGAGFSTLLMLAFIYIGGFGILESSANASLAAFVMSAVASVVFVGAGDVDWQLFLPVTAGGVIGAWLGVESAVKFGGKWVHALLLIVLAGSIVRLILFP
ncbi:MAG: sulfite exporter TauE/SafE family protein [bacterium]